MGDKRYNPGIVNTDYVRKTSTGVSEKESRDGGKHVTAYDDRTHRRISWDENTDGSISGVHSTDADRNHINYKGAR